VFLDVVYNHTAEGHPWTGDGLTVPLLSMRGLDNPGYYQLGDDVRSYRDDNGVGPNLNATSEPARDLVLDSLRYWAEDMGVDGFRFDLTSVLGNACDRGCFRFDADDPRGILRRAPVELPGVALMAEPWGTGPGTYQLGNYPPGWSEWNGQYRDDLRSDQNQLGQADVTPGQLANRLSGSWELFGDDGRTPSASLNFLVAHDGFTLADLCRCADKVNDQPWPYGPSDGGSNDNRSSDHGGDAALQRRAARTGFALLMVSAGVPMFNGGDEFLRSQNCNNNPYNVDSAAMWLDPPAEELPFTRFARRAMQFRREHVSLRPRVFRPLQDGDGDGLEPANWRSTVGPANPLYLDDPDNHFVAVHLDGDEVGDTASALFVAYNGWVDGLDVALPTPAEGRAWHLVADTHDWMEGEDNWLSPEDYRSVGGDSYLVGGRSVVVLLEQ
jgi:glycogen operon protein